MFQYQIYGLRIESVREIDLLDRALNTGVDLRIEWHQHASGSPETGIKWNQLITDELKTRNGITLWQSASDPDPFTMLQFDEGGGRFLNFVLNPQMNELSIYYTEDELKADLESFLVGPVLGFVLRMKQIVCLHSSVVEIDGRAVALIGQKTTGKSTTAAGLSRFGARPLADDMAVLEFDDETISVESGYSYLRLRPTSAKFMNTDGRELPIVYSDRNSRYFSLEDGDSFHAGKLPLAAIIVLGEIDDKYEVPRIEELEPQQRLVRLVENTFGSYAVFGGARAAEFTKLARLAATIPMRKLLYSHNIETLPAQCELIIEHVKELFSGDEMTAHVTRN